MFVTKADRTPTAVFVESGIEALSYRALRGTGLVFSTTGSAVDLPAKMGSLLQARGYEIVAAFNADKGGDRMAERMRDLLGSAVRRDRPPGDVGKDWNEQLRSQRTHRGDGGVDPEQATETERVPAATPAAATRLVR
jgi:hypothetical protein